jgi:hypothetical protein
VSEAGPRRPSQRDQWRPGSLTLSASKGWGERDLSAEGASGLGSDGIGVPSVERVLGSSLPAHPSGRARRRSATGSVRELIVRPVQWKKTPAHGLTPPTRKWSRPLVATRRGEDDIVCLSGCTSEASRLAHAAPIRGVTRGRKCLRAIWRQTGRRSPTPAQACWGRAGC